MRRFTILGIALLLVFAAAYGQEKRPPDTPKAAKSRKKLKEIVSVDYDNTPIREVEADLKSQVEGLPLHIDSKGGVSANLTITFKAEKKPLEQVLDGICKKKGGLGYYIVSKEDSAEDGSILITNRPKERGYRTDDEAGPAKKEKSENKTANKDKNKDKSAGKDKAEAKEKKSGKEKADEKTEDEGDKAEQDAARKLNFAKTLLDDGKTDKAKARFEEIVSKFPKTKAAQEAKEILKKLDK